MTGGDKGDEIDVVLRRQKWTVFWDRSAWFAEGQPFDICAYGKTLSELGKNLEGTVVAEIAEAKKRGVPLPIREV